MYKIQEKLDKIIKNQEILNKIQAELGLVNILNEIKKR